MAPAATVAKDPTHRRRGPPLFRTKSNPRPSFVHLSSRSRGMLQRIVRPSLCHGPWHNWPPPDEWPA